jgi:hypothetical protein
VEVGCRRISIPRLRRDASSLIRVSETEYESGRLGWCIWKPRAQLGNAGQLSSTPTSDRHANLGEMGHGPSQYPLDVTTGQIVSAQVPNR